MIPHYWSCLEMEEAYVPLVAQGLKRLQSQLKEEELDFSSHYSDLLTVFLLVICLVPQTLR